MTNEKEILFSAQGVKLTVVRLRNNGIVVQQAYHVSTLRTPETWNFDSHAEASARYLAEVTAAENDPATQQRLARR